MAINDIFGQGLSGLLGQGMLGAQQSQQDYQSRLMRGLPTAGGIAFNNCDFGSTEDSFKLKKTTFIEDLQDETDKWLEGVLE